VRRGHSSTCMPCIYKVLPRQSNWTRGNMSFKGFLKRSRLMSISHTLENREWARLDQPRLPIRQSGSVRRPAVIPACESQSPLARRPCPSERLGSEPNQGKHLSKRTVLPVPRFQFARRLLLCAEYLCGGGTSHKAEDEHEAKDDGALKFRKRAKTAVSAGSH
jgi:hypothetical protein